MKEKLSFSIRLDVFTKRPCFNVTVQNNDINERITVG
ncbi:hypothetical protein HDF22_001603 [Mucilaginibacter lappiensis]|uniref:Uncharacterized protein n=1 Tax=Mucilaginibacter lappiensis TaxID=354630 RepID=A0A841JGA6_9SPHI|nr:hypothetical protein [Mucilaginibacter lappiensis]